MPFSDLVYGSGRLGNLSEQIDALRNDPASREAAELVRRTARDEGAFQAYAEAFYERAEALEERGDAEEAIESYVESALVFEEEVDDLTSAARGYESVLRLETGHRRALFALGLVLHDLGRWDDLIALYRRRMETSTDGGERTTLHLYVAELLSERIGDDDAAFTEILRAVRLTPTNIRIVTRLEQLGEKTGRIDEVAVAIGDLILHQEDPRIRAALSLRLAELHLGPLGDAQRALAYLKAALADDGGNPEILAEIEDVFRERARFDELAEVLEATAKDRRVGPHRVRLERELARIYELELGDLPRALAAITRAVEHSPEDRELLDEVMRLGLMSGDLVTVSDTYEDVCEATDNALLRTYMRLKLGHIYANVLDRPDEATRVYEAILETDPQHAETRRRLMKVHERRGDTEQIIRLLELEAEGAPDDATAVAAYARIVALCDEVLDDSERAVEACRRVLEIDPDHELAARVPPDDASEDSEAPTLDRDLDAVGDSAVATDATEIPTEFDGDGYGPEAETHWSPDAPTPKTSPLPPPRRVPSTEDLVLDGVRLIEPDAEPIAADGLVEVVSRVGPPPPPEPEPHEAPPEAPAAEASSEEASSEEASAEEASAELVEAQAASIADPAERATQSPGSQARRPPPPPPRGDSAAADPAELFVAARPDVSRPPPTQPPPPPADQDDLERQLAAADLDDWDSDEIVAVAVDEEAIAIPVSAIDEEDATEALVDPPAEIRVVTEQVRHRAPSEQETMDREVEAPPELDEAAKTAARLAQIQKELAEATEQDDRPKMIELLEEIVATNERLEQAERAFFSIVRLAKIDPTVERIHQTIRLGRRAQGYPLLIDTVEGLLDNVGPEQRVRLQLELAEIEADDLGDIARALARFERLGETAPDDDVVLGRHLSVLDAAGRHEEVAAVLVARAAAAEDPKDKRGYVLRAVTVYDAKLDDLTRAADLLVAHYDEHADDVEIAEQAAELLERTGRFEDLVALYEKQASRSEGEKLSQLRLEIAQIHREALNDIAAAEAQLRRGVEERARDPQLLDALEKLLLEQEKWGDFVDVGLRRLEVLHSVATKNDLRKQVARVSEERLASPDLALELLTRALADDPTDVETLVQIERLRRQREDWDGVVEVLLARVEVAEHRKERIDALLDAAEVQSNVFGDFEAADATLRRALEGGDDERVLYALADVAERRGDDDEAIRVLRRLSAILPDADRAALHVRIGRTFEERFTDREAAHAEYEAAYQADVECREAIIALLEFAEGEEDFIRAHELAAEAARLSEDERDENALYARAGLLAQERVGDDLRALDYYGRALAADPDDLATEAIFGELLLARGDLERALPRLAHAANGLSDPERSAQLHRGAARAADELERHDEARDAYAAVLEHDPTNLEALDRLGALLTEEQEWERVYELGASLVLHHELELAAPQRSAVYFRMARAKHGLEDFEAAARLAKKSHQLADREIGPLRFYAQMLERAGDAFEAAECLKRLSGLLESADDKKRALMHAGRLLGDGDGDLARASAMLTEAQTYGPDDVALADQLSGYRVELQDPLGGAEALVVPAYERSGRERADLLVRAARVLLASGRERSRARELLLEALEIVPTHAGARADLSVVLEFDGDVDELVRIAIRAADCFVEDEATAIDAGHDDRTLTAIELYADAMAILRHRLEMPEQALALCRKLMALAPESPGVRETYARLLDEVAAKGGPTATTLSREAIVAWAHLVERTTGHVEGLERLTVLRRRVGDEEEARVTAEILEALHEPVPEDATNGEPKPYSNLDTRVINALRPVEVPIHPAETSPIAALFEAIGYAPLRAFAELLPEPRPKKRDLAGAAGLGIHVSRPIGYTARVLGQDSPPVYVREDAPEAVNAAFLDGPAIVVSLAKAEQRSLDELRFLFGRCFSMLRPRALMFELLPLEVLREALIGLAKMPDPSAHNVDAKAAKKRGKALERALDPADRGRVTELVQQWLANEARRTLGDEREGVLRTAERFGLVVSGSVATSIKVLSSQAGGRVERGWHTPLLAYASTREYAQMLRRLK